MLKLFCFLLERLLVYLKSARVDYLSEAENLKSGEDKSIKMVS
jgi:hypothetical protein